MAHNSRNTSVLFLTLVVFVSVLNVSAWAPRRSRRKLSPQAKLEKSATQLLMKYGYYTSWVTSKTALRNAVNSFQTFNRLPITGEVDKSIVHTLKQPRCGVKDPHILNENNLKSYYLAGSRWKKQTLTWYWDGKKAPCNDMTISETIATLRNAFDIWREACIGVDFQHTYDPVNADLTVKFSKGHHQCVFPHDGPGMSMGHAFYPYANKGLAGDIHFDDDEIFTLKSTNGDSGINFLWAATHSIGHSLGLEHSHKPDSMMYPWYNRSNPTLNLHQSDIDGIQSLYPNKNCVKRHTVKLIKLQTVSLIKTIPVNVKSKYVNPTTKNNHVKNPTSTISVPSMTPKTTTKKTTTPVTTTSENTITNNVVTSPPSKFPLPNSKLPPSPTDMDDARAIEKFDELFDFQLIENVNSIEELPLRRM